MIKKLSFSLLAALFALYSVMTPTTAYGQTNYDQVLQNIQFELINAIYSGNQSQVTALFQVLLDLLALQDGGFTGGFNSSGSIDISTERADDVEEDEAELRGEINFSGNSDRAYVWFEYGEDRDELEYETSREYIDDRDDEDFSADVDDLDEDEKYYFRAVAEDRDTRTLYFGDIESFVTDDDDCNCDEDEPDVDTRDADDIRDDSAEISGFVDMNDFRNGIVFFLWGEDEDELEDSQDEEQYADIREQGDDLQKSRVDSDLDDRETYTLDIGNLDDDTEIFYAICVEYEDEDNDDVIDCGDIEDFRTDD